MHFLMWIIWREKIKHLARLRLAKLIFFSSLNYPPPDHNLGQILNSDPARSYSLFNTPTCNQVSVCISTSAQRRWIFVDDDDDDDDSLYGSNATVRK